MAKEAYLYGKRGLRAWQKRPTCMAKEAYVHGKRGPLGYLEALSSHTRLYNVFSYYRMCSLTIECVLLL